MEGKAMTQPPIPMTFDGDTYDPPRDEVRLTGQALRVWNVMKDGLWRSLWDIAGDSYRASDKSDSEAAISARLRDFRKARFGGHTVERRYVQKGLHQYRLIVRQR